jgi:hypothetical protein
MTWLVAAMMLLSQTSVGETLTPSTAAPTTVPTTVPTTTTMAPAGALMFVIDVSGDHVPLDKRQVLTEAIALAFLHRFELDVQTLRSLQDRVAFAEQQQLVGCDSSGCLAEIANAMGARFVVFSRLVNLGGQETLRVDLYDTQGAQTLAIASTRAASFDALHAQLDELVDRIAREVQGEAPVRAHREVAGASDKTTTPAETPAPSMPPASRPVSTKSAGLWTGGIGLASAVVFGGAAAMGAATLGGIDQAYSTYRAAPTKENAEALLDAGGPFGEPGTMFGTCSSACLSLSGLVATVVGIWLWVSSPTTDEASP